VDYERLQEKRMILNYSSIENGVDSLEIRLWTSLGHTDLNLVDILKYENNNWHYSQNRYWYSGDANFPNKGSKMFLDSAEIKSPKLDLAFSEIIAKLKAIDLRTLPSQSQITGFSDNIADGEYYDLEVATKNYYRHLFFHEPRRYSDSVNQRFSRLIKLLAIKAK